MKRFYREVAVGTDGDAFTVLLDGRPVRTPARHLLRLPARPLAEAVAGEWREQGETVVAADMPLTKLATTTVDLMPARREDAIAEVVGFAGTDLLCYRASSPESLVVRQVKAWQPWLDWAQRRYDAGLLVADDLMPITQPEPALRALRQAVERLDDWRLVGLHAATSILGSLVLGLALAEAAIDVEQAWAAGLLDELFEIEQWGEDAEQQARLARLRRDLVAADRYLHLLTEGEG